MGAYYPWGTFKIDKESNSNLMYPVFSDIVFNSKSGLLHKVPKEYIKKARIQELGLISNFYTQYLKIGRIAFRNNCNAEESLILRGRRKQTFSGWISQSRAFYENALVKPEFIEAFNEFNITPEKMEAGQVLVNTTVKRDFAFDALKDWMSDFVDIARIALED